MSLEWEEATQFLQRAARIGNEEEKQREKRQRQSDDVWPEGPEKCERYHNENTEDQQQFWESDH
jgi:hypothetical protein